MVVAVLRLDLSVAEKVGKITDILNAAMAEAPAEPSAEPSPGDSEPAPSEAMAESIDALRKQIARMERSEAIRESCDALGITVADLGADRLTLARDAKDADAARRLIESWAPTLARSRQRPVGVSSARRLQEGEESYDALRRQW
jgi:hypothetical protein